MRTIAFCIILCLTQIAFAQTNWQLKRNNNGIKVYTSDHPGSSVKMVRVEVLLKQSAERVAAEVMNVQAYKDWIYGCIESTLISRPNDSMLIYRHVTDAPWPFEDRDQVSLFIKSKNQRNGSISIVSHLQTNYPKNPSCTRILQSSASWFIQPLQEGTKIVYNLSFDPGGNIPAWLINLFIDEGPYSTFVNLKKRLGS